MLCPRCDSALHATLADATGLNLDTDPHVDHCHGCGGIWIDSGALSLLMDLPVPWLRSWEEKLEAIAAGAPTIHEADLLCPVCQVALDERAYAADSSLYLDRCTCCRGTWLDRGELVVVRQISIQQDVWRPGM